MQKLSFPQSISSKTPQPMATQFELDDAYILEMDHFIKTLSNINTNDVKPDLIGSIITHYASKWLPDLAGEDSTTRFEGSHKSATASWMKKRFFIESIVAILPQDKDCVPCNFLLRLLRTANMVGVDSTYSVELEKRVSWNLDEATLKELMIPSFNHNCTTLLDIELVTRLVMRFVNSEEVAKSGAGSLAKVAKLVDCYLAEAAVDSHLKLSDFVELASALPSHARSMDDRLYRAIDTYLKAHPGLSKQERKTICNLIDSRKLSPEASYHAAQNERLPVRAVIQVLLSEQTKLYNHIEWSGSFSGTGTGTRSTGLGLEGSGRCHSKREMTVQHLEIQRLKEDILRLQCQCMNMERQIEKLTEKKSKSYNFSWKKLGIPVFKMNKIGEVEGEGEANGAVKTPLQMKARLVRGRTSTKWRKSSS